MAAMMSATTMAFNGMPASVQPRVMMATSAAADPLEASVSAAGRDSARLILARSGVS
jgi:hypothetical protein